MKSPSTILAGVAGSLVVLLGLIWFLGPKGAADAETPTGALAAAETNMNFGETSIAAGLVTKSFAIKNTGAGPVVVSKIYTSCMCTVARLKTTAATDGPFGMAGHGPLPSISRTLAPGEEAAIEVTFDPGAHGPAGIGPVGRTVTVETKDGGKLTLGFRATVTP